MSNLIPIPHGRDCAELFQNVPLPANETIPLKLPTDSMAQIDRVVAEYHKRSLFTAHGLRNRKHLLLHGPPGCGKSLTARHLAHRTGLPMVKANMDEITASYLGSTSRNLRVLFESLKKHACICLMDELDMLAMSREDAASDGKGKEDNRIVGTLLTFFEEYDIPGLIVCTTNMLHSLDNALFRRFDLILGYPYPDLETTKEIIQTTLRTHCKTKIAIGLSRKEMDELAASAVQREVSAANLVRASQEAIKAAIMDDRKCVFIGDFTWEFV